LDPVESWQLTLMSRAPSFVGLILAAGESKRMGRDKALLPWHGRTLLEAHINALQAHTDFVLVVAGKNCCSLQSIVDARAAFLAVNPQPEQGQFSSLQTGLQEVLNRGRDAAIVTLVDHPPVNTQTIVRLRRTFAQSPPGIWAVVPEHDGRHGHPLAIGREMITAFLQAETTSNAREVEHANQQHIAYVAVDDPFTVADLDTPEDYDRITK
jgi:molybdenum cofactor cytidylyltransferase